MPRSVNSVAKRARRKKTIKQAKGYFGRRKNVWTVAKNAVEKAIQNVDQREENLGKELSSKYGVGRVNIEDGTFTPAKS